MAKETAFEIFTKGCLHMKWDTAGKVLPLIKDGQVGFQILSRDLVEQSFGWAAGAINPGT